MYCKQNNNTMKYRRTYSRKDKDFPKWDAEKLPAWYYVLAVFTAALLTVAFLAPVWMPAIGIK